MTDESTNEKLIRLEGKLDAYAAGQSARLDGIDLRLNQHDVALADLRTGQTPVRTSSWVVVSTIIGGLVGLGSLLTLMITLMQIVPDIAR